MKIYAWGNDASCVATWPGENMRPLSDNPQMYYWDYDGPVNIKKIIIHDGNGNRRAGMTDTNRDANLDFENGKTYYVDGSHSQGDNPGPQPDPTGTAGAVQSVERRNDTLVVTCENATLYLTPYSENVVKVFTLPNGVDTPERESISVSATPDADFTYNENHEEFILLSISNGTKVMINKSTGLLSFYDTSDRLKLAESKYLDNTSHSVKFNPMQDAAFYGGGYHKWGSIKNHTLRLNNTQTGNWSMTNIDYPHNICIPFVVSSSNYGVLFDDHYINAEISPSSAGLSYKSDARNPISYYFVGGDDIDEVVANYTSLTGRASLPPYWALGYITSRYGYHSEQEADGVISSIRNCN
ncbi:MAG: DUF4968 domain-containing protein, partial [Muribaculaceae bacterium]|nr:DUF4968 domain-containing protein [Muribaculaceae bacterium]